MTPSNVEKSSHKYKNLIVNIDNVCGVATAKEGRRLLIGTKNQNGHAIILALRYTEVVSFLIALLQVSKEAANERNEEVDLAVVQMSSPTKFELLLNNAKDLSLGIGLSGNKRIEIQLPRDGLARLKCAVDEIISHTNFGATGKWN